CGETQTYAGPLRGEKRLKHLIDNFCWNRCPVALDEDLIFYATPRAMLGDLNMEMPTGVHRFACVFENTEKDLLELGFVTAACRYCFLMMGSEGPWANAAPGAPAGPVEGAWLLMAGAGAWRMSAIFTIVGSRVRASVCW